MEHAEVVKARKAPKAPLPALTRAPPPPKPAAPKPSLPKKTATVQTAVPRRPVVWEAPERPVDRLRGGGGGGGAETFAAEQERLAREAKAEAARLRKEAAERRAAHEAEAASPARLSRPPSGSGASYGVGTPQGLSRAASASAHGSTAAATPADDPYAFGAGSFGSFGAGGGAAADPFSRLPAPMPYTAAASPTPAAPFTGAAGGEAGGAAPHELPAWLQLDVPAAPAAPAADWGAVPTSAAHDASGGGGGGVTWLEPVYDGRDGAPEEEIDDLLSLLGIAG